MSTAKTRFNSRAQLHRGDPVSVFSSSTPCWRGVGMIALRKLLWGRQTATIAHQVDAWQGHEGYQLFEQFQWREPNPRGAIGPRMGEGIDEIAVGVLCEALQRYRAAGGITDQALQLVAPMGGDLGVGVERKAPHAGTAGTGECWRLARM